MVWWIWVLICIYLCIGAWASGLIVGQEESPIGAGIVITLGITFFWIFALILAIVREGLDCKIPRYLNPVNWFNSIVSGTKSKWSNTKKFLHKKLSKNYDEFDYDETSEGELHERHLRMGLDKLDPDTWKVVYNGVWDSEEEEREDE
jgi:hypothetical protein